MIAHARRRWSARSGAVAVEFGMVGALFIGLLLFCLYLGFRLYVQVAVDYAASRAARLLSVDGTQKLSHDQASFQAAVFCPLLSPFLACNAISVALWPVADYLGGSAPPQGSGSQPFSAGQGGNLMLLQVQYGLPAFGWPAPDGSAGGGGFGAATVAARFPFQNEY